MNLNNVDALYLEDENVYRPILKNKIAAMFFSLKIYSSYSCGLSITTIVCVSLFVSVSVCVSGVTKKLMG